ncbi:hypothetical protein MP638_007382 [Amoeboaphelidium occidentale]|nr:hypothetical protein MP638_007382 [Amoeboaphelidium occidentale]
MKTPRILPPLEEPKEPEPEPVEEKELDLDEIDDLLEQDILSEQEEQIMNKLRLQRMHEMKSKESKRLPGGLVDISQSEFVKEVTEASKSATVLVHLYQNALMECRLINEHLEKLSRNYRVKCVKIKSTDCIPGFPDRNLPTVLVYKNGDISAQYFKIVAVAYEDLLILLRKELELSQDDIDELVEQKQSRLNKMN